MGADNQQERLRVLLEDDQLDPDLIPSEIGNYLTGFTDGEGSFNVSFRPRSDYTIPWKISLCFNISQKDPTVLRLFQLQLRCGTMRQRQDGVWYYEVNNLRDIRSKVIPFFEKYSFLSEKKKRDFRKFMELAKILSKELARTEEDVKKILLIRSDMNDGGKRRYTDECILKEFENPQRLNARSSN